MMMIIASCSQFCRIYGHMSYWKGKWNKWNGRWKLQCILLFWHFFVLYRQVNMFCRIYGPVSYWKGKWNKWNGRNKSYNVFCCFGISFFFFFCIDKRICRFSYVIVACPFLLQLVDIQGVATTWTNWFHVLCCDIEYCDRMGRILSVKLPNVLPLEFLYLYFRFQWHFLRWDTTNIEH
jgi:hypothetical protein